MLGYWLGNMIGAFAGTAIGGIILIAFLLIGTFFLGKIGVILDKFE